jgi:pyruvate dehydrogenase E1 component alpha subunit
VGDINREYYRSKQEEHSWKTVRDPIRLLADFLLQNKLVESSQLERVQSELRTEMEQAVAFATAAPYPNPAEVSEDVYA